MVSNPESFNERQREAQRRMQERQAEAMERMRVRQEAAQKRQQDSQRRIQERLEAAQKRQDEAMERMRVRQEAAQKRQQDAQRRMRERQEKFSQQQRARQEAQDRAYASDDTFFESFYEQMFGEGRKRTIRDRLFRRNVKKEQIPFEDFFKSYQQIFDEAYGQATAQPQPPKTDAPKEPEPRLSPAEITRRRLMTTLPQDDLKTLGTVEKDHMRSVIATVYRAREIDPERTDWDIYVAYRRAIEVTDPDPVMVEKTQIAGLLLNGTRDQAKFPF